MVTLQKYEWFPVDDTLALRCVCSCGWSFQHLYPESVREVGELHQTQHTAEAARRRHPAGTARREATR